MDNEAILNEIVNGTQNTQDFTFEGLSSPLTLRPLPRGELLKLKKLEKGKQKGKVKIKQGMNRQEIEKQVQDLESDIVYGDIIENTSKTITLAVSLSAGIPEKLINDLPNTLVDDIFEKVMEISKITEKDLNLLKDFRKDE